MVSSSKHRTAGSLHQRVRQLALKDKCVVEKLIRLYRSLTDPALKGQLILMLGGLPYPEVLQLVIAEFTKQGGDLYVRQLALSVVISHEKRWMTKEQDRRLLSELANIIRNDAEPGGLRNLALSKLQFVGHPELNEIRDLIGITLSGSDHELITTAYWVANLLSLDDEQFLSAATKLLRETPGADLTRVLVAYLSSNGGPAVQQAMLIELSANSSSIYRAFVAENLSAKTGDRAVRMKLIHALFNDPDPDVQLVVIESLRFGVYNDSATVEALKKKVQDHTAKADVRLSAASAALYRSRVELVDSTKAVLSFLRTVSESEQDAAVRKGLQALGGHTR